MSHSHHSHHHHHESVESIPTSLNRAFLLGIVLNVVFVLSEFIAGFMSDSIGLISDAGHNLSDVASLVLSLLAYRLSGIRSNARYTYGYKKSTVLVSLLNAVILLVAVGVIISESIEKLLNPRPVEGGVVIVVASVGVLINAFTAWLFLRDKDRDLNIKGAYLHMAADALVSVGVAISGVIIMYTGWSLIDPVIGLVVAGVIIYSTWGLLHDSIRLSLDGVPVGIDCDRIVSLLREIPGVSDIHHLHIWALSTTETALTVHVELSDASELEKLKREIKRILSANRVTHTTIEFETVGCGCSDLCK